MKSINKIQGKTRLLGLIGDPVEHTLSPLVHNTIEGVMNEASDVQSVYVPFRVDPACVREALEGAYALNILGMNATVPHKLEVIPYLKGIDETAKQIGAVNTLVRCDGGFFGYNTDAEGFMRELDFYGIEVEGKCAVMLGAGGASKAVAYGLAVKKAAKVYIANRTIAKAEEIAAAMNEMLGASVFTAITYEQLSDIKENELIVVQCTSVGLAPDSEKTIVPDCKFYDKIAVGVDIIYKPENTLFMRLCREHGALAYNGIRMLLYQGVAANEKFLGRTVSKEAVEIAARKLEAASGIKRPVVLTGYMGSGKSTVAECMCRKMGLKAIDTDVVIEEKAGMTINEIFAQRGEAAFRDMETALIKELIEKCEYDIISTGGGMPVRAENRKLLATLGTVVYLKADADTIYNRVSGSDNRPLLKEGNLMEKIERMLGERGPLYMDGAGIVIDTSDYSAKEIADELLGKMFQA